MRRDLGVLVKADDDGYLPRIGQQPNPVWAMALDSVLFQLHQRQDLDNKSIVLRGSLARGTAVQGVSDIDLCVFVCGEQDQAVSMRTSRSIDCDISVLPATLFLTSNRYKWLRFYLAHAGYTMWGKDLLADLAELKLGVDSIAHLKAAHKWLISYANNIRQAKCELAQGKRSAAG